MNYDRTLDNLCINTIQTLALDAVKTSGGDRSAIALKMAPLLYRLWQHFLRYDPEDPLWPNRDRFVLSSGYASPLLYAILHLSGVRAVNSEYESLERPSVGLDDLKRFRRFNGKCPEHPEYRLTSGIETSCGPLGQGAAASVGMAMAGKWQASYFNRPGNDIFDYNVYSLCGDGCMMEGVSGEAASMAGHLKLSNLCWIYDAGSSAFVEKDNSSFREDVAARFVGYGWNAVRLKNLANFEEIDSVFAAFNETSDRPTLIVAGDLVSSFAPLTDELILEKKSELGFSEDVQFSVSNDARRHFRAGIGKRGRALRNEWTVKTEKFAFEYPAIANQLEKMINGQLPDDWDNELYLFESDAGVLSPWQASIKIQNAIAKKMPWYIGGSADASSLSARISIDEDDSFSSSNYGGRNIHFGVREHAMGSILNGMALCGLRPYGSDYLIFSDYERPAIRLSSFMEIPVVHIFFYDSNGEEEDDPTSQPVEQLACLRSVPGLITLRPADANEVVEAWRYIIALRRESAALVLSRQPTSVIDRTKYGSASELKKGAYVLADSSSGGPDVLLMATGVEVALCLDAYEQLKAEGIHARVVSMPSLELFERQNKVYRDHILPPEIKARVAVEQASTVGWSRYVGTEGAIIGMNAFGASAPLKEFREKYGFDPDGIVAAAKQQLGLFDSEREDRDWI